MNLPYNWKSMSRDQRQNWLWQNRVSSAQVQQWHRDYSNEGSDVLSDLIIYQMAMSAVQSLSNDTDRSSSSSSDSCGSYDGGGSSDSCSSSSSCSGGCD